MARSWLQISSLLFVLVVLSPSLGEIEYEPRLIKKRATLVVIKGYSVDIKCQLNDSLAEVSLLQELTKGSKTEEVPRVPDGNKVTQSRQIFTINNVSNSDKGKYKCKVKSWVLTTDSLHRLIYGSQGKVIDILIDPQAIAISEGESATFACKVRGDFKSVEWFKDKVKVPLRYITYSNCGGYNISSIQLPAVSVAQAGSYECRTTVNIQGFKPDGYKSKSARLYVTGGPQAQVYPVVKEIRLGEDFNFSCQAAGDDVSIKWLRNGQPIPSIQTYSKPPKTIRGFTFTENILMLQKVSKMDDSNYTCVVTTTQNPGNSIRATAVLQVKASNKVATSVSIAFGILVTIGLFAGSLKCFFLQKKRKSSADNIQILSSEFVYHAFIIYSQEDSKWVTGKLLPCLEEKHNFKCCVHYRDFAPGKPFEESMAESVYTSHKVIAVMSRNFFKSNYCRYELNIAKYRLLNKGDDSLIIIRIDNADCGKLPKELRKRNVIDFSNPLERPLWEQKLLRFLNVQWEINQDCAVELSCEIENTDNSSALLPRRGGRLNSEINAVDQNRGPVTEYDSLSEENETVL